MDVRLSYTDVGVGEPLILLHGNGESRDYFKNQIDFFSAGYRVIAPDTRGHGRSSKGTAPFTLYQFAEDLKDFMDSLSLKKAHLLGFSDGGNIALLFALKYPDYIDKLILNGANLTPSGVKISVNAGITAGYAAAGIVSLFDKKAKDKKEMLGLMIGQPNIKPSELAKLKMPVLVIAGSNDMIRSSHTKLIADSIPNSELAIIEGDHFIAAKNSGEFNKAVLEFLQKQ